MITVALWLMFSMMLEQADQPFIISCTNPHLCGWHEEIREPMDVPAIQEKMTDWYDPCNFAGGQCSTVHSEWTCADKSRVLLTDEQGGRHCIKF